MDDQVFLEDEETLLEVRAAILLAAATGVMEYLMGFEKAKHTKRYRKLDEMSKRLNQLFDLYPLVWEYDIVSLGIEFFDKEHEERLQSLFKRGIQVIPPETPEGMKKLKFDEKWKRGDVLHLNGDIVIIDSYDDANNEYHFRRPFPLIGIYFSSMTYPNNPLFVKWRRIEQLGENSTDHDLRNYANKEKIPC